MEKKENKKWFQIFEAVNFNFNFRLFASILVTLTVPLLFLYRFFPHKSMIEFNGFPNTRDFVYYTSLFVAPLIIIIGTFLNAYKISYLPILFVYSVDVIWTFNYDSIEHYSSTNIVYAILITAGIVLSYKALLYVQVFQSKIDLEAQEKLDLIQKEIDRLEAEESDE